MLKRIRDEEIEPTQFGLNKKGGWEMMRWWKYTDDRNREFILRLIRAKCNAQLSADRKEFIEIVKGVKNPHPSFGSRSQDTVAKYNAFETCRQAILKEA